MIKIRACTVLLITMLSTSIYAGKTAFLTVTELVDSGYTLLSGLQILEIMENNTIQVVDIETDAVVVSKSDDASAAMDRKFVEKKSGSASSSFDARLMARAPALEGKIDRRVAGDELISTDGVRTYHFRLYKKQERIFAVRDIDNGDVFFEVEVK